MPVPEQPDYFFIESHEGERATMYARGEGMEVVAALARISLFQYAHERRAEYAPRFGDSYQDNVYKNTIEALVGTESTEPQSPAKVTMSALALSDIMHLSEDPEFDLTVEEHNTRLLEQLQNGARSPDSVHREIATQIEDRRRLTIGSRAWFNEDGLRVIVATTQQRRAGQPASRLLLRKITRNTSGLEPEAKEKLFPEIPKNGKAHLVRGVAFRRSPHWGMIDQRRPFMHGGRGQETLGYIASGSDEFVPVVKQLSNEPAGRRFYLLGGQLF